MRRKSKYYLTQTSSVLPIFNEMQIKVITSDIQSLTEKMMEKHAENKIFYFRE